MNATTTRYAIRIKDLRPARDDFTGFLGTADNCHLVCSAATARHFPTIEAARRTITRIKATPHHFLAESRRFAAYVVTA